MLINDTEKLYPSAKILVRDKVASRLHAKDASLYDFDEAAAECAKNFTGWATLASQPPYPYKKIQAFAESIIAEGFKTVLLIGQGGSTQAPMTITKYNKVDRNALDFKVLDSVPPTIDAIAPTLFARLKKSAPTRTQQNAVSRPPNANMLIFQMTLGGTTASTNTITPTPRVTIWLERATTASLTCWPLSSA